jgi:hypothetical protein
VAIVVVVIIVIIVVIIVIFDVRIREPIITFGLTVSDLRYSLETQVEDATI